MSLAVGTDSAISRSPLNDDERKVIREAAFAAGEE